MLVYRISHTTGNAQFGGVHQGFDNPAYHAPGLNSIPETAGAAHAARQAEKTSQLIPALPI
jgi:hypothetical protein